MNPNHFDQPSCELCGLTFPDRNDLQDHMTQHAEPVTVEHKVFDCTNCRKTFLTFDDLDRHNKLVHAPY